MPDENGGVSPIAINRCGKLTDEDWPFPPVRPKSLPIQEGDLLEYRNRRDRERHEAIKRIARQEVADGTYDKFI